MDANELQACDQRVEIIKQILSLSRKHFQLNSAQLEETGFGSGQIPVLLELNRGGELNQRELAERTHVTPATMSGTLKRMEKNGFIVRTPDENDARISRVRLTEEGKEWLQRYEDYRNACKEANSRLYLEFFPEQQ